MGWNAETGMWEPDVMRQPLGALGSVMQFHNARQARDISDQLSQQREAQIAQENERLSHEQEQGMYERQLHEAMGNIDPNAPNEEYVKTFMRAGGNPAQGIPFLSRQESSKTRLTLQDAKVAQAFVQKNAGHMDPDQMRAGLRGLPKVSDATPFTDDEIDQMANTGLLPEVKSKIKLEGTQADLNETKAGDIEATQSARIGLMNATKESRRMLAEARAKIASGRVGAFGPKEKAGILAKIAQNYKTIEAIESKRDVMTFKLGAVDQQNLQLLRENTEDLEDLLKTASAAPVATPPGPTGSAPEAPTGDDPLGMFKKPS